jgi:hypothetical protein
MFGRSGSAVLLYLLMVRFFKILLLVLGISTSWGCERDYMFRGGSEGVSFSLDTVMFDTIFTSIGSATRHFRVYNPYGNDMTIDAIKLAGGEDSKFRININGIPEHTALDVQLRSGDSLFVFIDVTIDPAGTNAPFVVMDSILFFTKERVQDVKLVAYGQDVVLLRKETIKSQTFTSEKPYLIYDWLMVDTASVLTIEEGSRLHFYQGASLFVHSEGSLIVNGTRENPVVFSGSRLESMYADVPGQWGYIYLMPGSANHIINYAQIRHATIGLIVDSVGLHDDTPLLISNTKIEHNRYQGLVAQASSVIVHNSLFGASGSASVQLAVGGHYEFYHCTIANYYRWGFRTAPALIISNFYEEKDGTLRTYDLRSALFSNCIIYGQAENEIGLSFKSKDDLESEIINYKFSHSLIRTNLGNNQLNDPAHFSSVIVNRDPAFVSPRYQHYNYQLDTLSVAKDVGDISVAQRFPVDILGSSRLDDLGPDLGFMERIEKQE